MKKLDGSLMTLYRYRDEWHIASSGMPDGSGKAHAGNITFAQLFEQTWKDEGHPLPDVNVARCYIFELMPPMNRIIVQHKTARLVPHAVGDLDNLQELVPELHPRILREVQEINGCIRSTRPLAFE